MTTHTSNELVEIASAIDQLAAQLSGIRPIAQMICDSCNCGTQISNSVESIGALSDYINRELSKLGSRLATLAENQEREAASCPA